MIFTRRSRELGFSLGQVRVLLGLASGRRMTCAKVKTLTEAHVADIRQKVKALERLERVLKVLAARCPGDEMSDCPILDALAEN